VIQIQQAKEKRQDHRFHEALEILKKLNPAKFSDEVFTLFCQEKAQCYYQDRRIHSQKRFQYALEVLDVLNGRDTKPLETLCLRGAIYKRKFSYTVDISDLLTAIGFYREAAENYAEDKGYGAGNTVFLYRLLLYRYGHKFDGNEYQYYESAIDEISSKAIAILERLPNPDPWNIASLAMLYLAKKRYCDAREMVEKYIKAYKKKLKSGMLPFVFDRNLSITVQELIEMAHMMGLERPVIKTMLSAYGTVSAGNGSNIDVDVLIDSVKAGKVGLALSGGGFRAALFHIGTLMRLAELDVLRHVQVISTVSGGSIVGMMYYLMLKREFEKDGGQNIDYIELIKELKKKFLEGVQKNLRLKAFAENENGLTQTLGKLYQNELYKLIDEDVPDKMQNIGISPYGFKNFNPHFHNLTLKNKVPRIIINATLLNNGHNWQFTEEGMGEQDQMFDHTVDKNKAYPFCAYEKICGNITIGQAVAASSAVPGLFDPVEFSFFGSLQDCEKGMTQETVRLSDGGVYDNLGLASLVNDECTHIIISDGSKQMIDEPDPSMFRFDVIGRTNDILMTKNRDAEYRYAKSLKERGILRGLAIVHMKEPVKDKKLAKLFNRTASVRTDLDAFHDTEAYATMLCGYEITRQTFAKDEAKAFLTKEDVPADKEMKAFKAHYRHNQESVLQMLDSSSQVMGKMWKSYPAKIWKYGLAGIGLVALLVSSLNFTTVFVMTIIGLLLWAGQKDSLKKCIKYIVNTFARLVLKYPAQAYLEHTNGKYLEKGKWRNV